MKIFYTKTDNQTRPIRIWTKSKKNEMVCKDISESEWNIFRKIGFSLNFCEFVWK